jgi:hypothetical protein
MYFTDFRLFAEESLACAREATSEERRKHYLAMADMWNNIAARQERDDRQRGLGSTQQGSYSSH